MKLYLITCKCLGTNTYLIQAPTPEKAIQTIKEYHASRNLSNNPSILNVTESGIKAVVFNDWIEKKYFIEDVSM